MNDQDQENVEINPDGWVSVSAEDGSYYCAVSAREIEDGLDLDDYLPDNNDPRVEIVLLDNARQLVRDAEARGKRTSFNAVVKLAEEAEQRGRRAAEAEFKSLIEAAEAQGRKAAEAELAGAIQAAEDRGYQRAKSEIVDWVQQTLVKVIVGLIQSYFSAPARTPEKGE